MASAALLVNEKKRYSHVYHGHGAVVCPQNSVSLMPYGSVEKSTDRGKKFRSKPFSLLYCFKMKFGSFGVRGNALRGQSDYITTLGEMLKNRDFYVFSPLHTYRAYIRVFVRWWKMSHHPGHTNTCIHQGNNLIVKGSKKNSVEPERIFEGNNV